MPQGTGSLLTVSPAAGLGHDKQRLDQLGTLVDHCTAAQAIADAQGDKFLSYMLAMTIQAAQGTMRPQS